PVEIARWDDRIPRLTNPARPDPVRNRRQALAGKFCIGGGLVPTDAANRVIVLAGRIGSGLPNGWPRRAAGIAELADCRLPGQNRLTFDHLVLPVSLLLVSASVHKRLELPVRDLVLVDETIRDVDHGESADGRSIRLVLACRYRNHAGRQGVIFVK